MRTTIREKRVRHSKGAVAVAMLLAAGAAHAQSEIIVDNGSPGFSTLGSWPTSTAVGGYYGTNYQTHVANGVPPGAIVVDNSDPGFAVTGTWPTSTAVAGYYGANYQVHAGNGAPPSATAVDNTQGSAVGTWPASTSVGGYYGSNYQTHAAGTGTDSFTWTLNVATAGSYEVYARWTASPNRASNAKYTVAHSGGSDVVTANQQQNGASWQLLGTYAFDAGAATVSLSDDANGYLIADAVMLQPPNAAPNTATWTLNVPSAGTYNVYARWTAHPNRASDAKFSIDSAAGSSTVTVNQQQGASGQWNLLGSYGFNAGAASVSLSDQANGYVIADAVMLAPPGTPPNSATWTPSVPAAGSYEVYAWWTANPNRATNATYTVAYSGGTSAVTVNQQTNGGAWNLLGAYTFGSGTGGNITLTDQANGYVIADAIRLVPVQGQAQPAIYYIVPDHLNTPRMIANQLGTTVWKWDQAEPFGATQPNADPDGDGVSFDFPLRFPGQYFDKETTLAYNVIRDYSADLGRYVESDPAGLNGGINTYAYVENNPVSYVDALGLFTTGAHVDITRNASQRTKCQGKAGILAYLVGDADFGPGHSARSVRFNNQHAQAIPGQSPSEAEASSNRYIDDRLKTCTLPGLADALHTTQDKYAGPHTGYSTFYGGTPTLGHMIGDSYLGSGNPRQAEAASRDLINQFILMCPCACD